MLTLTLILDVPDLYHEFITSIPLDSLEELENCRAKLDLAISNLRSRAEVSATEHERSA